MHTPAMATIPMSTRKRRRLNIFRFGISSDGKKLYLYGSGSTLEIIDAATLNSRKLLYLNRDITTNLITLARK